MLGVILLYLCSGFLSFPSDPFSKPSNIKLSKLDSTVEKHIVGPQLLQLPKEMAKKKEKG